MSRSTPWGASQHATPYGNEGVCFHSTASHGGMYVPRDVRRKWPAPLRSFVSTEPGWYEEDCEFAIVVLAMPHLFEPPMHHGAIETCHQFYKDDPAVQAFLDSGAGKAILERVNAWEAEQVRLDMYRRCGSSVGDGDGIRQFWNPYAKDRPRLLTIHQSYMAIPAGPISRTELETKYGAVEFHRLALR